MFLFKDNNDRLKKILILLIIMNTLKKVAFLSLMFTVSCGGVKELDQQVPTESVEDKSVKLKVIGTEPFWSLEVTESIAYYQTPEQSRKAISITWNVSKDKIILQSKNSDMKLQFVLTEQFCSDGMSDQEFTLAASGKIDEDQLRGCAKWMLNEQMVGKWMLKKSKGVKVEDFSQIPYIELDGDLMQMSGNLGCNGVSAKIVIDANKTFFDYISTTLMWCDDMEHETILLNQLKTIDRVEVVDNLLKGFHKDELLIELKKYND